MPVGLYMERSLAAVAALIAIVKAGACYVPLDTADPSRRIAEILRNAEIRHVFTQRGLRANLPAHDIDAITIEELWSARADTDPPALADPIAPDSLAYIMFTSGTTGQPKGVCVTHRNVLRLVLDTNYVELGPREVLLQFAPLAFDASTLEIWGTLLNGGRLVVHPERVPTARDLAKVLRAHRISTLWLTAGFFHYMVENEVGTLAGVRQVLAGGDVLSVAHVQKLLDAKRDGVVVNGYGPTENTTFTCCHPMTPGTRLGNAVPIGRPIANTCVYILDAHGVPTPVGVAGELFAGGDGVARGYLGKPDATAERFLPDPFAQRAGATMYRTGDLARWRADGTIEFIGRRDRQVKVRGFRIELDEIETTLRACAPVRDAAVIARRDASGANTLVAYLVPGTGVTLDQKTIKQRLAERLPDYMVPGILMVLDDLPLTSNGKLDRSALPEPQAKESTLVVPRTMLEAQIHAIWERVLGRTDVGVHDNFFDLGGHSLLAVRLFAQIESVVGRRLPISVLFQAPTVAQLAARMEQEGFSAPWASLVAIQPEGAKAPLFLIPGIGGNVVCYGAMARELGSDQPLYALQSRGLDGRQPPFERIEPMAAHYVEEIRKVQPRGPYHLGGSCFGGVVAYEMAQQLRAAGEEVSRLFLLESWPPPEGRPFLRSLLVYANRVRFLYTLAMRNFVALAKLPMSQWHSAFRERIKVVTEIATTGDLYRGDSEAMYADRVSTANHRALLSYRPRRYSGALFSIIASRREFQGDDGRKRWRELSGQGYEQLEVPARDSGTLLESPHIEHVAAWIKRHLPIDAPTVNAAALPTDQHRPLESAAH
jgi:aspartate racemase